MESKTEWCKTAKILVTVACCLSILLMRGIWALTLLGEVSGINGEFRQIIHKIFLSIAKI
ncbi:hypothetical protein DPC56_07035 [Methanothermobacter tenebrarum]|uniref:Uncharacterized protein n=1 Tax=Methanothermobacter tenebrarum TaxID=680118 RepID=A0A328P8C5_9EURY|nr:hypothetical protein DPC56_07035 [Methanothermobacter tenebrarum]